MKLKYNNIILLIALFLIPNAKSAETIFLYQGTLSRTITIEELYKFILFDSIKEVEDWRKGVPGEPLSIALSALIGWTITLRRLIRVISKSKKDS